MARKSSHFVSVSGAFMKIFNLLTIQNIKICFWEEDDNGQTVNRVTLKIDEDLVKAFDFEEYDFKKVREIAVKELKKFVIIETTDEDDTSFQHIFFDPDEYFRSVKLSLNKFGHEI